MATVAADPTSGTALTTVFRATCADVSNNDATAYDSTIYPTEPQISYYFKFSLAGQDDLISPIFSTNSAGIAEWNGVLIPAAGTWTLDAIDASDDSVAATVSVEVA